MAAGVAPLVVPVRALDDDAARPDRVADQLLATVPHYVERIGRLGSTDMLAGATRRVTEREDFSGGLRLALPWLHGELARDLGRQVEVDLPIPVNAKADALRAAFDRIAMDGLQPIIVFDDTDRWLGTSDEATVEGFFTESLRWLTDLPVSIVVATHHAYVPDQQSRRRRLQFLPTRIDIPPLPSSRALAEILARRVDRNCVDTPFAGSATSDAFEDEALGALLQDYPSPDSLRQVMLICYASVRFAINEESERVTADHVAAARDGF
jgi:Cdc6-like AAA superfamily ATPase